MFDWKIPVGNISTKIDIIKWFACVNNLEAGAKWMIIPFFRELLPVSKSF